MDVDLVGMIVLLVLLQYDLGIVFPKRSVVGLCSCRGVSWKILAGDGGCRGKISHVGTGRICRSAKHPVPPTAWRRGGPGTWRIVD